MDLNALPDLRHSARVVRVRQRPVTVSVAFAAHDGVCETREGDVGYRRGDAIITGTEGERWPVRGEDFPTMYQAIPPTEPGRDGRYVSLSRDALARRLDAPLSVPVGRQRDLIRGEVGDWLLQYDRGGYGIVSHEIFERTYQQLP